MAGGFRRIVRGESRIDFMGRTKIWASISAVVLTVSLLGLFGRELNLSLEFRGGTALQVVLNTETTVAEIEEALSEFELGDVAVQISTNPAGQREALVRTRETREEKLREVQEAVAKVAGQPDSNAVSRTTVGPSWGRQVSNKALFSLFVFLIVVSGYISMRFEPKMALGALGALFHDLIAAAGLYALIGFEVSPATVIALLTLMGFSLYDTVVVFDRIRENAAQVGTTYPTYSAMMNRSINEVMMRSINTSLSSVLPVAGLLFVGVFLFGAVTLKDLALAMFLGTLVSTYSSIFVAAPILGALKEREPRYRALRARALATGADSVPARLATADAGAVAAAAPVKAEGVTRESVAPRPPGRPAPGRPSGVRPRKRKRGKRR